MTIMLLKKKFMNWFYDSFRGFRIQMNDLFTYKM